MPRHTRGRFFPWTPLHILWRSHTELIAQHVVLPFCARKLRYGLRGSCRRNFLVGLGERTTMRSRGWRYRQDRLRRAIYLSFFKMAAENPNLDPRGKHLWEVFASAYTAATAPRILLTCSRVGLSNILCSDFDFRFCTTVYPADVMMDYFFLL